MWMKLMLGMIGGYFGDLIESICGAVCSSRQKGSKVSGYFYYSKSLFRSAYGSLKRMTSQRLSKSRKFSTIRQHFLFLASSLRSCGPVSITSDLVDSIRFNHRSTSRTIATRRSKRPVRDHEKLFSGSISAGWYFNQL